MHAVYPLSSNQPLYTTALLLLLQRRLHHERRAGEDPLVGGRDGVHGGEENVGGAARHGDEAGRRWQVFCGHYYCHRAFLFSIIVFIIIIVIVSETNIIVTIEWL